MCVVVSFGSMTIGSRIRPEFRASVVEVLVGAICGMLAAAGIEDPRGLVVLAGLAAVGCAIWWIVFGIPRRIRAARSR